MNISDFKVGDCISYINESGCQYVSIIKDINIKMDNITEAVCICYEDPTSDEEGYMWYDIKEYKISEHENVRMATDEERKYLEESMEDDDLYYNTEKNEVMKKKKTFQIERVIKPTSYYTDKIEVEAETMEQALAIAEKMNDTQSKAWETVDEDDIIVGDVDIQQIELMSKDNSGEDCKVIYF